VSSQKIKELSFMADLKDLFPNRVTETVQQPASGVNVTEATDKSPDANVIGQAESQQQAEIMADTKAASDDENEDYIFTIEHGAHKVTITPDRGGVYNFHAVCKCAWEGRFVTSSEAESLAKKHISLSSSRG
jgi:hypothetical protein